MSATPASGIEGLLMAALQFFADTNLLVYARDANEPEKRERARAWMDRLWHDRNGCLSYQVLQEFYITVTQKLNPAMPAAEARQDIRALVAWQPVRTDVAILEAAWRLQEQFLLSWWDALIVAAAEWSSADYLLTEGLQEGQDLNGIRVMNPFRQDPGSV
ncbi:MAG: PIN domain-containing protein [Thiohalorhabdus sp.]|uniref:PIN domain-containing protein n=1 Tax=Thiohalorhabdus sp. TaxID=3094134 RepID=UPI0039815549